jgi:hypothetical protein
MKPIRDWLGDKRVAGVLAGVAVLFVGYRLIGSGTGSAPAIPATAVAPSPSAAVQAPAPSSATPSPPPADLPFPPGWTGPAWSWNRNPFLGPAAENTAPDRTTKSGNRDGDLVPRTEGTSPDLRGTVVSGATAMAIFGSRLVPVGGMVGEWTLLRVEPYRVTLLRGKETRVLELYKQ